MPSYESDHAKTTGLTTFEYLSTERVVNKKRRTTDTTPPPDTKKSIFALNQFCIENSPEIAIGIKNQIFKKTKINIFIPFSVFNQVGQ